MPYIPNTQVARNAASPSDIFTLAGGVSSGASALTLDRTPTGLLAGGSYLAVGATTTKCEVRRVTAASGTNITLSSALVYSHSASEVVYLLEGTLVPFEWFGCKANDNSFDSYVGLQQAFNDLALAAGRGYGLTGHISRYYSKTPLCIYDNTYLEQTVLTALSPMSIDLSVGNGRLGTPDQYHVTLGGQFGTITSVDTGTNSVTLSTSAGAAANDRIIFQPSVGATLPGGLEAGRQYFIKTFPGGNVYTLSQDYSGTELDITSSGSGTSYFYSTGFSRMLWDWVTLEGSGITNLNGVLAALQQPAAGRNVRIDGYLGASGGAVFYGQQCEFYNLMVINCTIGVSLQGMQFLHVFGGNIEANGTGVQTLGLDPAGTSTAVRDIQLHGIHFEANTTKSISLGDNTVGFGIYGGVNSGAVDWLVVDSSQVLGYSVQNFSSITNSGNAIVDSVRGITLVWDDSSETGVAGQIANLVAPATHGLSPSKSWWLFSNESGGQTIVWDAHLAEFRLNGANTKIRFGDTGPLIQAGANTPEGTIAAPIGSMFLRTNGGAATSLYVKESGTGNTGWVGK